MSQRPNQNHEPLPSTEAHDQQHALASQATPFGIPSNDLLRVGRRRWFLQTGLSGMLGLSLPEMLRRRAEAANSASASKVKPPTSVIQIWLSGGPSQVDMWDMKPEMPAEVRGPFRPIATAVPGIDICEHMPKQAAMMDKLNIIRSVDASSSNHTPITMQAGNPKARRTNDGKDGGGYPSMGSVAAKFRGASRPGMPPFVALANSLPSDVYGAGQLGTEFEPLDGKTVQGKFAMPEGVNAPRLKDRDQLRREFDRLRRHVDASRSLTLQDRYVQEAYDMVLGGAAQQAFDLNQEPDGVRDRYGRNSMGEKALLARRLVEAGVSYVVMSDAWGHWDHHGDEVRWGGIVKGLTPMMPVLDHGLTTLIDDLDDRGLLETTLILVAGEFGRGPVMTKTAGRGHWTPVMSMLVAGGGTKGGQVIGSTDRRGGSIKSGSVGPGDLAATVFRHLGIDPYDNWVNPAGRPIPLVDAPAAPIRSLY